MLGPFKAERHWWQNFRDIISKPLQDTKSGSLLAAIADIIRVIDKHPIPEHVSSIYHLANALQHPISWFLKSSAHRREFYAVWISEHQDILSHGKFHPIPFYHSLTEQSKWLMQLFGDHFNLLAAVFYGMQYGFEKAFIELIDRDFKRSLIHRFTSHWKSLQDPTAVECTTILLTLLSSNGPMPKPALGYHGPDYQSCPDLRRYLQQGRLQHIDQSHILYTHSGMKQPQPHLFKEIYCQRIWQQNPNFHFGRYPHDN